VAGDGLVDSLGGFLEGALPKSREGEAATEDQIWVAEVHGDLSRRSKPRESRQSGTAPDPVQTTRLFASREVD
jgi:hypothetical protein